MNSQQIYLGWDVGGTKSSAIIADAQGNILKKDSWHSHAQRGYAAMLQDFLDRAVACRAEFPQIEALGVSIGGPLDSINGIILSPPNLPGWDHILLKEILQEKTGIPTLVEHDAAACLLAEYIWGAARQTTHAIYITAGTGCGAGVLINGQVLRGPRGESPEVGHIRLAEKGPFLFGKKGSAEAFCSGTGVAALAHFLYPTIFPEPTPTKQLAELAENGHPEAREVLLKSAQYMGQFCANLADTFIPQRIIIGSLARYLPAWWLEEVRHSFQLEVLPINGANTLICPPVLGDKLQDLSAIAPCIFQGTKK